MGLMNPECSLAKLTKPPRCLRFPVGTPILRRMRCLAALLPVLLALTGSPRAAEPVIRLVDFETEITPVTVHRITDAIDLAEAQGEELVLGGAAVGSRRRLPGPS